MANRTVKDAHSIKGTNPQYLIEKIIRTRIYECRYWKEECFALSAELLVDKAMELRYIGGIFGGNVKPTPFLCLILKMLQIQPEKDIIIEFIKNVDFKYVRALGAIYMRLTGTSLDCYQYLEPLYLDYRKLRRMNKMGKFEVIHVDEYIDELLREERSCDVIMPRIQKRQVLEETNQLDPRMSALEDDMDEEDMEEDEEDLIKKEDVKASPERRGPRDWDRPRRSPSPRYKRSRSKSPRRRSERDRDRDRHGGRDRDRDRDRHGDRDRDRRDRRRSRSRSRDRQGDRDRHRKRSRSRSRDRHGHKSSSSRHDDDRHRSHKSSKKSRRDKESRGANDDDEIAQANALRAKLGMAPLK